MSFNNTTNVQDANITQLQPSNAVETILEPSWLVIVRLTVESIIALAGIIGNLAVCFAISKHRALNTAPTNTYIRNVAVGDLATLLVSFPLGIVREQFTYWPLDEFTCRYIFPLSDIFFGVSVWSITAIAVDRHRMLTADVPRLALRSLTTPRIVCTAIWIFSFLGVSLPLLLVYEYQHPPSANPQCVPAWPYEELPYIYSTTMSLVTYVIPLSLILVTYCAIKRKMHKSESFHLEIAESSFSGSFKTSQMSLVKTRSKRVTKIMTPVVVVFAITVLPLSVVRMIPYSFYQENAAFRKYSYILFKICIFFYLFNSACNPLIYSLVSRRFRQSFREMLSWN